MKKKLKLLVLAFCLSPIAMAQQVDSLAQDMQSEQAYTFTEAQLGEDDDVTQNITIISSNRNVYATEVGYRFSPARFKYRAFNAKYNDIYINGNPANDAERGEFRYSFIGGLNNQTRAREATLPFEDNNYMMAGMAGSNNYNFRPSSFATGHRVSVAGANRNYNARAMYTYNTGVTPKGWAFTASLTYRWGNGLGFVEGTSYNSLSYFVGIEKILNDKHSLSLVTWGNPTERGTQAASTDEMYWIANDNQYNSAWGYQNGKKRNSRIVKDFAPAGLLTWDWKINDDTKLVTSLLGKYSMYSSSRLNYNNSTNPAPDYYSTMPSYYFNVWDPNATKDRDEIAMGNWQSAYDYLSASKENRQINWDRMYFANRMASLQGSDAMYYLQRYHDDQLSFSLSSNLKKMLSQFTTLYAGLNLSTNKGMHYQTMDDLLGASTFHNINTYVIKNYGESAVEAQYDMNNPNKAIGKGDRFGYDYNIYVNKAQVWAGLSSDLEVSHWFLNGRIGGVTMQREGNMRNGLAPNNSYGKSGTAKFLDGGVKAGAQVDLGKGNSMQFGIGYESKAPVARTAFQAAQINNNFVKGLKNENVFSAEIGYRLQTSWLKANLNAYYSYLNNVTEQSMYYMDDRRSFTYVSLTGIEKEYYGVELGMDFTVTDWMNIKALGTISDAKYVNNANVAYMLSEDGATYYDKCHNIGMREGCTPLTAASLDLNFHYKGWFIDVIGNYYDRIYLYYTPVTRYESRLPYNNDGTEKDYSTIPEQAKGKGGFMLDASIGKSFFLKKGRRLGLNLMLTNILNNTKIVTGGREQSRTDIDESGEPIRTYSFQNNPYKYYINGFNGMLMINYQF
jgi:hypothetical protein